MKNNPSFYEKQPVVLLKVTCRFFKVTCRFLENKHLLFRKQPDVCLCYCTRFTLGNGISSSSLGLISTSIWPDKYPKFQAQTTK